MRASFDVAVVGGGPAGLATAAFACRAGLSTVVFERSPGPPDKACGEGVMPAGVRVLEALGALRHLGAADCARFTGIRYVQEDGSSAEGRLPAAGGLGIRRTALASALARCAIESGAEVRWGESVESVTTTRGGVSVATSGGGAEALLGVAADGLHSPLRRGAGLDGPALSRRRVGLRQHFAVRPWSALVEVHLAPGIEAFVTPAGEERVGLAFLWEKGTVGPPVSIGSFLERFPALRDRLAGARPDSRPRGSGPLGHAARSRVAERLVLIGDAAGYVDAITGEGISLALACAQALGGILPTVLERGADRASLRPYERFAARAYRRYAAGCICLLALARRPRLRRRAIRVLGRHPRVLDGLIALALA